MSTIKNDKIQKMTFTLLLVSMLLLCQVSAFASSVEAVQVRSAPLNDASIIRNGMVRVYLSSLGSPSRLDLTVKGNYSLSHSGKLVSDGTSIQISFSSATGNISIAYLGKNVSVGKSFALRRHSTSGTNGIVIAQSRESKNPYPGDLSFEAVSNGSGYTLYTIAHIYIENYLYGVLPYEMGNSSGMEALKAQAVAARTYTVRMMEKRSSGRYDVKDTTSDQVYRGTPAGNANCVAAVDATKGIVLMYGSEYITTYYSASNGGQTETARPGSTYAYMQVKDDPFDYANPNSVVKKRTIYADLTDAANPAGLISLLKNKAVSSLQRSGYPAYSDNITLIELKSVIPHTPMYAAPSRVYTQMDFVFSVSFTDSLGQEERLTLTETCSIFSELEHLLGMSIQTQKNELWTVEKNDRSFSLQARRYGHGMGMSQRGAMHMDKLGYSYDQILGFYFDGCKRVSHSFTHSFLNVSSGDKEITVEPPAKLEDSGDGAACIGIVGLSSHNSVLAVRSKPSKAANVIGVVKSGSKVEILADKGEWLQIQFGEIVGYVAASSLKISGTPVNNEKEATSILGFAAVKASDFVNLRASGSMSAKILGTASSGSVLTVFSSNEEWAKVQSDAIVAYVHTNYLSEITVDYPVPNLTNGSRKAMIKTQSGTGKVNLRESASTNGSIISRLQHGSVVSVVSDDGAWSRVVTDSEEEGYILSELLQYTDDHLEDSADLDADSAPQPEETNQAVAYVSTAAGSLNLRAKASVNSAVLTSIPQGTEVIVLGNGDEWTAVRYRSYEGYVMTRYLSFFSQNSSVPPHNHDQSTLTATVVTLSGTLNLRELPHTGGRILARIPPQTELRVLTRSETWSLVEFQEVSGYVMNRFLWFSETEYPSAHPPADEDGLSGENENTESGKYVAYVNTASGSLNLRMQPALNGRVLTCIPQYAAVSVTAYGETWSSVRYGTFEGYVMTRYLRIDIPSNVESAKPELSDGADETVRSAWVNTESGSLNLREEANGNARVIASIPRNAEVKLLKNGKEWSFVAYRDLTGYVMSRFLSSHDLSHYHSASDANCVATPDHIDQGEHEPYATVGGMVLDITLSVPEEELIAYTVKETTLYPMCSEQTEALLSIPPGEITEVVLIGDLWCRVAYENEQGYCPRDKLDVK